MAPRTEGFVLSPPGQGDFLEAVIADLGPMQPLRIPALSVECFDRAVPLLGDLLPCLLQCLCHLEVVRFFFVLLFTRGLFVWTENELT